MTYAPEKWEYSRGALVWALSPASGASLSRDLANLMLCGQGEPPTSAVALETTRDIRGHGFSYLTRRFG